MIYCNQINPDFYPYWNRDLKTHKKELPEKYLWQLYIHFVIIRKANEPSPLSPRPPGFSFQQFRDGASRFFDDGEAQTVTTNATIA